MNKQKVRPMIDKELRDEIVSSRYGGGSFNAALKRCVEANKRAIQISSRRSIELKAQEGEIERLKKEIAELSVTLDEAIKQRNNWLTKWSEAQDDLLLINKRKKIYTLVLVLAWVVIGAELITLFLT